MHLTHFQQRQEWLLPSHCFPLDSYCHRSALTCGSGGKCDDFGGGMEEEFCEDTISYTFKWFGFYWFVYGSIRPTFYSATFLMCSGNSTVVYDSPTLIRALRTIGEGSGIYFVSATVLILTAMSIERWLIVSRRSFFSRRRACFAVFALILTATPPAVLRVLENVNTVYGRALRFKLVTVMVSCYLIIMMANVKVYQSICRHQRQIQWNTTLHNFDGSAINVAKYKKSVMTMIYILLTFSVCFFPYVISTTIYFGFGNRTLESYSAFRQ